MPCSILTVHAYRSWMPDHPRGFVKDGQVHPTDPLLADRYEQRAAQPPVTFDQPMLELLHSGTIDIAARRAWRMHAAFGEPSHFHAVLSWRDATTPTQVRWRIVNLLSKFLGEWSTQPGRRWFTRRPSFKPVRDQTHLNHLVGAYCKKHLLLAWHEGEPEPPPLAELIARGRR